MKRAFLAAAGDKTRGDRKVLLSRTILAGLVAAVLLLASIAVYQQLEIAGLDTSISRLQQENGVGACGVNNQTGNLDFSPESAQVVSSSGLEMNLTVSSGSITCGETVYANVSLFNTLDVNLTLPLVTSSLLTDWGYLSAYPCGSNLPVQLAVFDGYYTESNFSEAGLPLQLAASGVALPCPTVAISPSGLVFLPDSGIAYEVSSYPALNGQLATVGMSLQHFSCSPTGEGGGTCGDEMGASGYYTEATATSNGFHLFHFGEYTIAALDAWGDTALVHFVVQ